MKQNNSTFLTMRSGSRLRSHFTFSATIFLAALLVVLPRIAQAQTGNPFAGSYSGLYAIDLGGNSATVGAIALQVQQNGTLSVQLTSPENKGLVTDANGTVNALGSLRATYTGGRLLGSVRLAPLTHSLTAIFSVVAKGQVLGSIFIAGPTSKAAFPGSYSGTLTYAGATTASLALIIDSDGSVTGLITPAGSQTASLVYGSIDSNNKLYISYAASATEFGLIDGQVSNVGPGLVGTVASQTSSGTSENSTLTLSAQ